MSSSNNQTAVCLISLLDVEDEDEKEDNKDDDIILCNQVSSDYDDGVADSFLLVRNLDSSYIRSNQEALARNEWFIEYSSDWVETGESRKTGGGTLHIPQNYNVRTIEPSQVAHHHSVSPSNRRRKLLASKLQERQRRLFNTLGERTVVVVSVDLSLSKNELYNYVFGPQSSLVSQMNDCSQSQLHIIPHPQYPVIEVSPSKSVSQYTFVDLYSEILEDIKKELGLKNGQAVTSTTDHLLLIIPDSINRKPGELGWGATPGFFAGIIESLAPSTMTMLHEGTVDTFFPSDFGSLLLYLHFNHRLPDG